MSSIKKKIRLCVILQALVKTDNVDGMNFITN